MSIPNVTMRWAQNQATCQWCEQVVERGSAMVVVFFWNKGANGRRWNVHQRYHPECWLAQGYDYLEKNPYSPYIHSGRQVVKARRTEEERKQRYLITRRFHSLVQRRSNLGDGSKPLIALKLECQMADLMLEMQKLGGVPRKWVEKL